MNRIVLFAAAFALVAAVVPAGAIAGDFDGSKPLVCASIHATECSAESQECQSGAPWMINFPVFSEIDFKGKTLSTPREHQANRVSKIEQIHHMPSGQLSILGNDGEYSWSMLISEETGAMTLTVSGDQVGFIVFGACTIAK